MTAILAVIFLFLCILQCNAFRINELQRKIMQNLHETASNDGSKDGVDKRTVILDSLANIIDPEAGTDIVSSGRVKDISIQANGDLDLTLISNTAKSATLDQIKQYCILQLSMLDWVNNINVVADVKVVPLPTQSTAPTAASAAGGIKTVKNIIAVSSCKGGVGKSTVAVNLAYTLQKQGFQVGILDADIYGPSLPTMTKPPAKNIFQGQYLSPMVYEGVELMSIGFLNPGAAIMRGPMVNQIINQLVSLTGWSPNLDYLIVDMPPGTGDIQLTLAQIMNITAAVIVTTPTRLSFVDVVKGIDMFDTVNVPSIAVVENMADYYTYDINDAFYEQTAEKIVAKARIESSGLENKEMIKAIIAESLQAVKTPKKIFGDGHLHRLREMWGMEHLISLPLMEEVAKSGDIGQPYVLKYPSSAVSEQFHLLANKIQQEVKKLSEQATNQQSQNQVIYDAVSNSLTIGEPVDQQQQQQLPMMTSKTLRCHCRCAVCVEELTGKKLLNDETISETVKPVNMGPIGKYAWSIDWSDGHKSLYPFQQLKKIASEQKVLQQ